MKIHTKIKTFLDIYDNNVDKLILFSNRKIHFDLVIKAYQREFIKKTPYKEFQIFFVAKCKFNSPFIARFEYF